MRTIIGLIVTLAIAFPEIAHAGEPFDFAKAAIESLKEASIAREKLSPPETTSDKTTPEVELVKSMADLELAIKRIEAAQSHIQPFTSSANETTSTTAHGFHAAYSRLIRLFNGSLSSMENFLDLSPDEMSSKEGTLLREQSKDLATAEEPWKMLVDCTIGVTWVLVDMERREKGKICCLSITSAEKKTLLNELDFFGDSIKGGTKAGQHPTEAAPAVFYDFFKQGWKLSDVK